MSQPGGLTQAQIDDQKKQKELLDAQKAALDAEKAVIDARKALVDAQKGLLDSQSQVAIARVTGGDVKSATYTGAVTMKDKAGTEEALLLAARAVNEAAARVVDVVRDKAETFYIFSADKPPSFQRLLGFRFRTDLVTKAFAAAGIPAPQPAEHRFVESLSPAVVSAGLDAAGKLLSFFKTDYEVGGTDAKIDESLLLFAVAGRLSSIPAGPKTNPPNQGAAKKQVRMPTVYGPRALFDAMTDLSKQFATLAMFRGVAASTAKQAQDSIADLELKAADPANAATKGELLKTAAGLKLRLDALNSAVALYDAFATSLTTADPSGVIPVTVIAQELAIDAALNANAAVLLLRLENTGGGYLVKKNLWTGLGAMPLYHMGGATVSYLLLKGADGAVVAGDIIPVYGGFVRTDALAARLEA